MDVLMVITSIEIEVVNHSSLLKSSDSISELNENFDEKLIDKPKLILFSNLNIY